MSGDDPSLVEEAPEGRRLETGDSSGRVSRDASGVPQPAGFWQVARRPKWIAVLLLTLAVAGLFAFLGRWQLERSFDSARTTGPDTETAVPLREISQPQQPVGSETAWRRVSADLTIVPGDTVLLSGRINAEKGWWVVAHALDPKGASLAVAAGWAATEAQAQVAADAFDGVGDLGPVTGRYLPTESPQESDFEAGVRSALSTAELVNLWPEVGVAYGGYLVLDSPPAGLVAIDAPAPAREVEVNFLNLFYALEWVVFAGAAVFIWWRLVRDEVEALSERAEEH